MDPNAAFDLMTAAWRAGDYATAAEHADNLRVWLAGGGFAPDRPDARYWINRILSYYGARPASPRTCTVTTNATGQVDAWTS